MTAIDYLSLPVPAPEFSEVVAQYRAIEGALDRAANPPERLAAIARWDQLRRQLDTWESSVNLRFQQDTQDAARKAARDRCDELRPKLKELVVGLKRKLLAAPYRRELEERFGSQAFALWEADASTYAPAIEADMVREARLEGEYTELLASARFDFHGQTYNLSEIVKFVEDPDRATRHSAEQARWNWFTANRPALDRIYGELVELRTAIAQKLGFASFTQLGYRRMSRIDYTEADVERFRAEVREHVVPLSVEIRRRQGERLGVDRLMFWDAAIHDSQGNPAPQGDHDWIVARAAEMFDAMGPGLGPFFRLMQASNLLDLQSRSTKAGGGFCTGLPSYGVPFVFANFNGTKADVEVLIHEIGHAYQSYQSSPQPMADYLWPTSEACEIHSIGLEFLTFPFAEKFFAGDAARYREIKLRQSLLFLPYGVAIDHFQHLVFANPRATPDERHAMWQEMERMYLPWCEYGDLEHCGHGGRWQFQRHIYLYPFYYIDYVLAQACSLQLWARAQSDFPGTMAVYESLCRRGGSAPFQELVRGAGLKSPFQTGCLREVVETAKAKLAL